MTDKLAGTAGVAAVVVFWAALFSFASAYPGYSHSHKAISELGALGAPHALWWNLLGFIVPGVLLSICGAGVATAIERPSGKTAVYWLLVLSGVGFAGAGVIPAEMRDGSPSMGSPFTIGHVLMTFLSGIPWVIAAFLIIGRATQNPSWHRSRGLFSALAVACVAGFSLNIVARAIPALASRPGLAQRISFAVYFAWFLVVAVQLLMRGSRARHAAA